MTRNYEFHVTSNGRAFRLQAFPTGRSASTVESHESWGNREDADAACARVNAGDESGITFGLYADD